MRQEDTVVIGAGPGGYPCAIRLAQLGRRVTIIERDKAGGECLNFGCIPSKTIIQAADLFDRYNAFIDRGIFVSAKGSIDLGRLQQFKDEVVLRLTRGVESLLRSYGATLIKGEARFESQREIAIVGGETIRFDNAVIATGSVFSSLPAFPFDHTTIIDARDFLSLSKLPSSLLVVGGGYIGLELGIAAAKMGSRVTVVEILEQIMAGTDREVLRLVEKRLEKLGVTVYTKSTVTDIAAGSEGPVIRVKTGEGKEAKIEAEKVLVSVGKSSSAKRLGIENAGIQTDSRGFIKVNSECRTNVPFIYAVGDVTGPPFLAHRATAMGRVAAEVIAGEASAMEQKVMPAALFTDPEIATTGMSLAEAEKAGISARVVKFPYAASGRALTLGESEGFVRLVVSADGTVIGGQIAGRDASELISEVSLAIEMGATAEDIALTVHPHPTLPEMIMEASELAEGKPTNIFQKGK
ncbi:MAG: dihydrolipoyl dehydrogenase [Thermoplasmata archaeon]|uniref:Dihydrolipoyl dehydrogenase n=1 Tax=Candidatus Sysuiplasma superficiale TaxID=2823368 RepID=A0A8J7YPU5_9ARCH|nr:dihydrolipoyl dehydrogenase [Candidatus Sysuiplasma superficiale]MBX8644567.1 dihydrolipoyl dehydrogenase [Candidatus Sysuiplasma superficiale]MCL4347189.1 dihydrolipoyl dehydrogenase [Candidatus Thermoplasmatota archaeon]